MVKATGLPASTAHPRAGGDDLPRGGCLGGEAGSSPRWRGRPRWHRDGNDAAGLIPALAGTTAAQSPPSRSARAHPRAGGDDHDSRLLRPRGDGSSPRWRGRPCRRCGAPMAHRLIPALAGTTIRCAISPAKSWAHPRAGGDDSRIGAIVCRSKGSSPRWRGRRSTSPSKRTIKGLIPALAGTTGRLGSGASPRRAHPRAGGDDCRRRTTRPRVSGLIPALAGTTFLGGRDATPLRAHPRAGGDDSCSIVRSSAGTGSSPRWRGRHPLRGDRDRGRGLIPALAGTTSRRGSGRRWRSAHPRAGGDDLP